MPVHHRERSPTTSVSGGGKGTWSHSDDVIFVAETITPVPFNTESQVKNIRLEDDQSTFTLLVDDFLTIMPQPQVTNTNQFGQVHAIEMCIQKRLAADVADPDAWANIPHTGVKLEQNALNSGVVPLIWTESFLIGDQFRIVCATDHAEETLDFIDSAYGMSDIPSIILSVT